MKVDPAASQAISMRLPVYEKVVGPLPDPDPQEPPPIAQQGPVSSLSAIEKQFASLIQDLSQQLASLEKQLASALNQLTAGNPQSPQGPSACPKQPGPPPMQRYGKIINDAARRHEVDPLLVGAVIRHESGFQPAVVSKAGAMGLMQLMPGTAKSLGVTNAFDPQQNVEGGTALLRQLLDRYHGQVDLALAAYNAGTGAVDKYGGIPPFAETQAYVRNVMDTYRESALSA